MQPWQRLASTVVLDSRWLRVTADRCRLPGGMVLDPFFVIHEPAWVQVLAVNDRQEILVVRQYRYPVGASCTELPGGIVEAGEEPLAAARRELLEETGFTAAAWQPLGTLYANPGRQTNRIHLFLAQELTRQALPTPDASEDLEHGFLSLAEIHAAIDSGAFSQAMHVASLYRGLRHLGWLQDRGDAGSRPPAPA